MDKKFFFGLGLGLVLAGALGTMQQIPLIGRYAVLIYVILGIVFLIKGAMK